MRLYSSISASTSLRTSIHSTDSAVATIWAIEHAARDAWRGAGAWLSLGAVVKGYPLLFLPAAFVLASKRRQFLLGAAVLALLPLLPLAAAWRSMVLRVIVFHASRGVHAESTWGVLSLLASKLAYRADYQFAHGALEVAGSYSSVLKGLAAILTLAAVGAGVWLAGRRIASGRGQRLAAIMFATLATTLAVGSILSPQYVIWLVALGAAAVSFRDAAGKVLVPVMILIAAFTQILYPLAYDQVVTRNPLALVLLLSRNLMIGATGLGAFLLLWSRGRTGP